MAHPRAVEIVTRVVLLDRDRILLVRGSGATYTLPGGAVGALHGAAGVVARERARTGAGPGAAPRFAGCVEHEHSEGDQHRHELTLLFAADLPPGERTGQDPKLVAVPLADLPRTDIRPAAVAGGLRRWLDERTPTWSGLPARDAASRFSGPVQTLRGQLLARRNELRSGAFKDAAVAMCALVAAADGRIDPSERALMVDYITNDEVLSHFDPDELQQEFEDLLDVLQRDPEEGRALALREIVKVRKRPAEANAVIQVGIVMGCSDGFFDDTEKVVVREAARALGLDPASFPLEATDTARFEPPAGSAAALEPEGDGLLNVSAFLMFRMGDRVLVATQRGGSWFFLPGGGVRPGESVSATLRRTVGAATGLSTSAARFAGAAELTYTRGGERYYDLGLVFVAPVGRNDDIASRDPETDILLLAERELASVSFRPAAVAQVLRERVAGGRPAWRGLPPPA